MELREIFMYSLKQANKTVFILSALLYMRFCQLATQNKFGKHEARDTKHLYCDIFAEYWTFKFFLFVFKINCVYMWRAVDKNKSIFFLYNKKNGCICVYYCVNVFFSPLLAVFFVSDRHITE